MSVESAKIILQHEIKELTTDVHEPFLNKYACQKIIVYLWKCHYKNLKRYEYKDWLLDLYKDAGMTESELKIFSSQVDLVIETIERNPKK